MEFQGALRLSSEIGRFRTVAPSLRTGVEIIVIAFDLETSEQSRNTGRQQRMRISNPMKILVRFALSKLRSALDDRDCDTFPLGAGPHAKAC